MKNFIMRAHAALGFSLPELMITLSVIGIMAAIAVPILTNTTDSMKLGAAARSVERELQTARLKAVSTNTFLRVRLNCPAAGQYRIVELIGTPSAPAPADSSAGRCDPAVYPYPPTDQNRLSRPNYDGPVQRLDQSVSFSTVQTFEFWPDGSVHAPTAWGSNPWPAVPMDGLAVTLQRKSQTKSIVVNGLGKIQLQ